MLDSGNFIASFYFVAAQSASLLQAVHTRGGVFARSSELGVGLSVSALHGVSAVDAIRAVGNAHMEALGGRGAFFAD